MDTSEKYIKMCEKATELLELWELKEGDCIAYPPDKITKEWTVEWFDWAAADAWETKELRKEHKAFPLWRQDQLQGMVESKHNWFLLEDLTDFMFENFLEDHGDVPYTPPPKKEWQDASMEQIWLAFVMCDNHQKRWDDEKGDWV